jgi:hypothetical protein
MARVHLNLHLRRLPRFAMLLTTSVWWQGRICRHARQEGDSTMNPDNERRNHLSARLAITALGVALFFVAACVALAPLSGNPLQRAPSTAAQAARPDAVGTMGFDLLVKDAWAATGITSVASSLDGQGCALSVVTVHSALPKADIPEP